MGLCEGNWDSVVRWDKQGGAALPKDYQSDGSLHVCPYANTAIQGQQTVTVDVNATETYPLKGGTCVPDGKGRFKIDYKRDGPGGKTYHYEGYGRVLSDMTGLAFIYGRVTMTAADGAEGGGDTGTWEAVRVGGGGRGHGGGEGPIANPSEGTVTVTVTSTGGVTVT